MTNTLKPTDINNSLPDNSTEGAIIPVFSVRSSKYRVIADYEEFCTQEMNELLKHPPRTFNGVLERLGKSIGDFYTAFNAENANKGFGKIRHLAKPADISSGMEDWYEPTFNNAIGYRWTMGFPSLPISMPLPEWVDAKEVLLTSIDTIQNRKGERVASLQHFVSGEKEVATDHPMREEDKYMVNETAEHVWSVLSQFYHTAMNPKSQPAARREAAIDCYWLMSHYMPYDRGSATAARITLEFMAKSIGFETGCTLPDHDLNLEALTRKIEDFQAAFNTFFDPAFRKPEGQAVSALASNTTTR